MKLHPRLSRATVDLVTRFETFQPLACPATEGGWTIGYGHTRSAREGAQVSRADAEALLLYDLSAAAGVVEDALFAPVSPREFEALTAFCFNIGPENFRRSTALARINAGAGLEAADEIERWRRAELGAGAQVVDALVRRRAAEKAHFLGLPEGFSKSPSAVLRPVASESAVNAAVDIPPVVTSATLSAANSVQARLRELVPEPAAPPPVQPSPAPAAPVPPGPAHRDEPEAPPFPEPEPARAPRPEPAEAVPYAPPPPPAFEPEPPPANDVSAAADPDPPLALAAMQPSEPSIPSAEPLAGSRGDTPSPRKWAKPDRRAAYALLTAVGACLLVIAAVLILGGKAGFADLGLGVIGALLMIPGVYGLLGPRPPSET